MTPLSLVAVLIVVGILLYLVRLLPLDATIYKIIVAVVVICVCFWLLNIFGLLDAAKSVPVPRVD